MVKIALGSDLHLEFGDLDLKNTENADVLILSGDIMVAHNLHDHTRDSLSHTPPPGTVWKLSEGQQLAIRFRDFLARVSAEFPQIICVAGNHEFYHGSYPDVIDWMKKECAEFPNIHFLEKETVELNGVTFIGGTLWTDMNKGDPITLQLIEGMMNDFRIIRNSQKNYRRFSPKDAAIDHAAMVSFIKQTVDADPTKTYVVVGHHAPTALSMNPKYATQYHMNGGYYSCLEEVMLDRPNIKLWTHGHTHTPFDYIVGETRVVCQPRGYIGYEPEAANFTLKFIEV